MAVETLSPDWEFDRVDDGSQSKGAARVDAPRPASALAALLREGSASRWPRSRRLRDTFRPSGCERGALSSASVGARGPSRGGSGWPGRGSASGEVTPRCCPRCPVGSLARSAARGHGWGAPGRRLALLPSSGLSPDPERSGLEEAEVWVPVSVSCFSAFPPNQLLEV